MFDLEGGWSISFAGCGFLGVYHIGVASCLLERAPYLVEGASKIYGASAGALTAAMLTTHASVDRCCDDVLILAREARRRTLGPLHPSFQCMKVIRMGLERDMPTDAHLHASGRLCVSLTRVSDGENVLVSQFDNREELIQALICSCFVPMYCGLIPPALKGVRYVDGGMSDNLPRYKMRNTITVSPFSGESDICPKDSSSNFHELRVTNTSIQMNMANMYRLSRALFPPEPQILAEMCQNGYKDALRFLKQNNLLRVARPYASLRVTETTHTATVCCCFSVAKTDESLAGESVAPESTKAWVLRRLRHLRKQHWCRDEQLVNCLPPLLRRVFMEACREKHSLYAQVTDMLAMRVVSYVLLPCTLPVESAYSVTRRFLDWMPDVSEDMNWLRGVAGNVYQQLWKGSKASLRKCVSMPAALNVTLLQLHKEQDGHRCVSSTDLHSYCLDPLSALTRALTP
ncbi:patatin-like phospholipase domain containing 3 [Scleropages formosus]|uniref:triacylglycerol lipase n=1 Tax=Scleropages formosus TaxID=113540 RepID=A0A8C9SJ35_SCLFO|nr:patatin-like phospholipase domain-containing protein 2 [Scleropages formosus]